MSSVPLVAMAYRPEDPLAGYQRMQELQAQARQQQQQQQAGQQQLQGGALDIQQKQIAMAQTKAMNAAFQAALGPPASAAPGQAPAAPMNGQAQTPTFDPSRIYQSLAAAGQGSAIPALQKHFLDLDKTAGEVRKSKDDHVAAAEEYFSALARGVKAQNYAPEAVGVALAHAASNGYGQEAIQLQQELAQNPTQLKPFIDAMVARSPKQGEAAKNFAQAGEATENATQKQAQAAAYQGSGMAPGVSPEAQSMMSYLRTVPGARPENYPAWKAQQEAIATGPQKIAVAQAEGQARANIEAQVARGSNAALAQVPPHLVAPASAAAVKVGEDFAQAQSVTSRLNAMMDAARKGNVVAYQVIPEEGTLQITTSQGVHRINQAEIQQYAGGGSLWQRMMGHVGKTLTGASIPSSVLDDMAAIQKIQSEGSQKKYTDSLKTINQNYGANFKPVDMGQQQQGQGGVKEYNYVPGKGLVPVQ
jgi:hypothetical protein